MRRGFTLIELLIVVVIIGILATIAVGKFRGVKEKAFIATMKSDLHNLINAQEAFFADSSVYYGGALPSTAFTSRPSNGVTLTLSNVSPSGWSATAAHQNTLVTCAVYAGSSPPVSPATSAGLPACQ